MIPQGLHIHIRDGRWFCYLFGKLTWIGSGSTPKAAYDDYISKACKDGAWRKPVAANA